MIADEDSHCRPLVDDGSPDIAGYNAELKQRGNPEWFNVPWLFSECYLYRYARPSRRGLGMIDLTY